MSKNQNLLILAISFSLLLTTACGKKEEEKQTEKNLPTVKVQTLKDSRKIKETAEYPATVTSEQEAKIIAKTSGTAKNVRFQVGDKVGMGQILAEIDEVNAGSKGTAKFNAAQIKQAQIAVEQTASSLSMARNNYQSLLLSSEKDLLQAEINKNQSGKSRENLAITAAENIKSAELAYETAKIAREQAKVNLDNRINISKQSDSDSITNSETSADGVANSCGSIISSINSITDLDDDKTVDLSYKGNLGALDLASFQKTQSAYGAAKKSYEEYLGKRFASSAEKIDYVIGLAEKTKRLADETKNLFDKSVTSGALPQSSAAGPSLNGLQSAAAGYQASANGNLASINASKQALSNTGLNNDSTIDNLRKVYELAIKQEESAKQNLSNLKAGNTSQLDQADFSSRSADNQLEAARIRLDSQLSMSKSQLDMAALSYNNAVVTLQNLYDIHQAVSPINGTVVKKSVSDGDTVSAGQVIAIVSQSENMKLQFYANQDDLALLKLGQQAEISDSDGKKYPAVISSITMQADPATKRYLVEVKPKKAEKFSLGSILDVSVTYEKAASDKNNIILPISAVEIGQNSSKITVMEGSIAKKAPISIKKIVGENVEISVDLPDNAVIVIDGNKLVKEGEEAIIN